MPVVFVVAIGFDRNEPYSAEYCFQQIKPSTCFIACTKIALGHIQAKNCLKYMKFLYFYTIFILKIARYNFNEYHPVVLINDRLYVQPSGCWGNLRERGHWGGPDVDGRIILSWIFRKLEGVVGTGWSWLRIGTGGGHL
jgi:hypothetical protein